MEKPIITPKMKIYDLLEAYPELEEVLIELVPTFKKLKNPVLRKTIARVTTLQQAAKVGEISMDQIIIKFRDEVGQEALGEFDTIDSESDLKPEWFDPDNVMETFDATPIINQGGHPLDIVLRKMNDYEKDEIFELITPFMPAPLVDTMKKQGFDAWVVKINDDEFRSFFCRI